MNEAQVMLNAGLMLLRGQGNSDGVNVIKDIMTSPTRGDTYKQTFRNIAKSKSNCYPALNFYPKYVQK